MGTILFDLSTCANNDDGMRQKYVKNYSYIDFINLSFQRFPLMSPDLVVPTKGKLGMICINTSFNYP